MITGIRLEHFRGFIDTQELHFGKINLFYGPNSGGKSTILRTLSLLKQSFSHNQLDHQCVLLPYSRDGVDMGSATSLHHNLNTSVPFSISLISRERALFRIARAQPRSLEHAHNAPSSQESKTGDARRTADLPAGFTEIFKTAGFQLSEDNKKSFFEHSPIDWTLSLTIADDGPCSASSLENVRFGNAHFMVHAKKVESSPGRGHNAFMDDLRNIMQHRAPGDAFEVLDAISDHAMRRRFTPRQVRIARLARTARGLLDGELTPSGCYVVDTVVLSKDYEMALGAYLKESREDITAFAKAVRGDLNKLEPNELKVATEHTRATDDFRVRLNEFFITVADFFNVERDATEYVAWWKEDLRRNRLLLFGYVSAEYAGVDIPPLAHWMTSDVWTAWRTTRLVALARQAEGSTSSRTSFPFFPDGQCDDIDDAVTLYFSTVEAVSKSLNALRDIGPDRSSAERVYRIEPRQNVSRDHVGRRATEIPRVLYEHQRLLDELNSWLKRVEVPYRLIVDQLEIRGGGGRDVRQTGLFELNAELSHSRNARINLSDVGHGLFKQLALPIQVFLGRNLIITIEEPETNVHPRLQAEIADLFIDAALNRGHQIFAEAHSEILSLRLRRRIAEGQIGHEDVRIFYVHTPDNGPCVVLPLELDGKGRLRNEPPGGFFDEWLNEV